MDNNWNLLGHEWAVDLLKEQIRRDSIRQAYLISGPPGVGRRTLALRFTQAINCPNPIAPGMPCGKCKTCQQIEKMQYPDLDVIQTEMEHKEVVVEQVRNALHRLPLTPYQGKYRVSLFLRFQETNRSSANALLKNLEEAPPHVVMILTADSIEPLLPTIVSRCEVLRLRPLPVERVESFLKASGADTGKAHLLAHISGGRPGYAMRLLKDQGALDFRKKQLDDMQTQLKSPVWKRFAYAQALTDRRKRNMDEHFRETLLIWLSFWRDVLMQVSRSEAPLTNVDRAGEIQAWASRLSLPEALTLVRDAEGAFDKLEHNANARLLTEVLFLDWPHV